MNKWFCEHFNGFVSYQPIFYINSKYNNKRGGKTLTY